MTLVHEDINKFIIENILFAGSSTFVNSWRKINEVTLFVEWPAYYNNKTNLLIEWFNPWETTGRVFLIKKTNDEGRTFETIVSNKWIIYIHNISLAAGDFSTREWCPKKYPSFFEILFYSSLFLKTSSNKASFSLFFSNLTLDLKKIFFGTLFPNGYCFVWVRVGVRN